MSDGTRSRSITLPGITIRIVTGCGKMYITLNRDDKGLYEAFAVLGKAGGCPAAHLEGLARTVSLALKEGVDVNKIIKNLRGIRCPHPMRVRKGWILSCADALGIALETYIEEGDKLLDGKDADLRVYEVDAADIKHIMQPSLLAHAKKVKKDNELKISKTKQYNGITCPACGAKADLGGGCLTCSVCGYAKCG